MVAIPSLSAESTEEHRLLLTGFSWVIEHSSELSALKRIRASARRG